MEIFTQRLREAMDNAMINQAELAKRTGFSKASISQYTSGRNIPTKERREILADALDVDINFLNGVDLVPSKIPIVKVTAKKAAECMGISLCLFRRKLSQGEYPFGTVLQSGNRTTCVIVTPLFRQYVGADWFDQFFTREASGEK